MKNQIMNSEIFKKGFAYIETLDKKEQVDPLLDSPLASIGHPDGWKTVVTLLILKKGYKFADAAEKLKEVWPEVLSAMNAARVGKKAKAEICTEQALRRRVLEVAMVRYKQAKAKLKGELAAEEQAEQTRILEEVKNLYEFLELELPADGNPAAPVGDEKESKGNGEAVIDAGNADKATVPAEKAPAAHQGEPSTPVCKESKVSTTDTTADDKKPDAGGTPPAERPVETSAKKESASQVGDAGKDGKGRDEFSCPKCGGKMAIKTARQGKNKGHIFYGCAAWRENQCGGTRDLQGQDTTRGD